MRTIRRQRAPRIRGVAIVEYVIILPVCLLLTLATAEFARAFLQYNTLTKAVRDGGRYVAGRALGGSQGIVELVPVLQLQTQNLVVYGNTLGTGPTVLPGISTGDVVVTDAGMGNVTVTANYAYTPIFAFIPSFGLGSNIGTGGFLFQAAITVRAL